MKNSLKLYYAPQTRAGRPRWALEELGVPYDLHRLDMKQSEHKSPLYLGIHPLGVVPALIDEGVRIIESVAICMHLADRFPEKKLAPPVGSIERGIYYKWIIFTTATIEPNLVQYLSHSRFLPEAQRSATIAEEAKKSLNKALKVIDDELAGQDFLLGETFSMADVVLGSALGWATQVGAIEGFLNIAAYVGRVTHRPAAIRARQD